MCVYAYVMCMYNICICIFAYLLICLFINLFIYIYAYINALHPYMLEKTVLTCSDAWLPPVLYLR